MVICMLWNFSFSSHVLISRIAFIITFRLIINFFMKKLINGLFLASMSILLSSCDPGFNVVVQNDSGRPIDVKVLSDNSYITQRNSIDVANAITSDFAKKEAIAITKLSEGVYTFNLKESYSAEVNYGIGGPDKKLKIIINSKDTLTFDSPEYHKEGGFMNKSHIFRIKK